MHGVGGIFGVLCVGIFADGQYGAGWNGTDDDATAGVTGILYDWPTAVEQLIAQAIGALVIWHGDLRRRLRLLQDPEQVMKGGIRPTAEMELAGMDLPEMGMLAYPEFVGSHDPRPRGRAGGRSRRAPSSNV